MSWTQGRDGTRVEVPLGWSWTEGRDGRRVAVPPSGTSTEGQDRRRAADPADNESVIGKVLTGIALFGFLGMVGFFLEKLGDDNVVLAWILAAVVAAILAWLYNQISRLWR